MLYSIVIPTRDRLQVLEYNLKKLINIRSRNIEIIVSDNGTNSVCKDIFDKITDGDDRFIYIKAPYNMNIYDHHEWCLGYAGGDYITILEDKKIFVDGAVDYIIELVEEYKPEVISYEVYNFTPEDDKDGLCEYPVKGTVRESSLNHKLEFYNPGDELSRMLRFDTYFWDEGFRKGQLLWGFYSRNIIEKTKKIFGSFFKCVYSFDSGCKLIALYLSEENRCIHINKPMMVDINLTSGRGRKTNDYFFLEKTYLQDVPNEELKKMIVVPLKPMINSAYFVAQEHLWIMQRMEKYGYSWRGYTIGIPGVIANTALRVYIRPVDNIPKDKLTEQKRIIREALNQLNFTERKQFAEILLALGYGKKPILGIVKKYYLAIKWIIENRLRISLKIKDKKSELISIDKLTEAYE